MPHNFQHLALITLLFPDSAIIHCTRDARDTCLSCYLHNFAGHHPYTRNLGWLGMHYRNYARLMQHWKTIGIPMHEVSYEQLVANPEAAVRELLSCCNLPWNDACKRFYENCRVVNTASRDQVRQPIYSSAIGRWKHYEAQLAPLIEALGTIQDHPSTGLPGASPG